MSEGSLKSAFSRGASKLFGKKASDSDAVSEEEIRNLVDGQDSLRDEEKRMIREILDLGDTVAREIMVPRVDMMLVEDTMTVREVIDRMRVTGLSRMPVFHDDSDNIVGVAILKDLLEPLVDDLDGEPVTQYMRKAVFVPETKDILPLLTEMQNEHQQLVIVVDEYGGTAGLITVEDIVEEIVGEIADEYDLDRKFVTQIGDNVWIADGRLPVEDAIDEGLPIEESDDYDTIAGWLMDKIDYVPSVGDEFTFGNMQVRVRSMRRRRIALLKISIVDDGTGREAEAADGFEADSQAIPAAGEAGS